MGGYWTELTARHNQIVQVVHQEEKRFLQTLSRGLGIFEEMAERAARDGGMLTGEEVFLLHDTYGFPLELTAELAQERGIAVDRAGFERALEQQRERARRDRKFTLQAETHPETYAALAQRVEPTIFTGYDELQTPTEVVGIIAEGQPVQRAEAGDEVEIVLAATPFYAEAGGQVGDTGVIRNDTVLARVTDTQRPHAGLIVHEARVEEGSVAVGDVVDAEVDAERRLHILPHHSGTHLLHKALQEVLGPEAIQAGSLVAPDRLRFDFRWPRPLTQEEIREVQDRVNAAVWANLPVRAKIETYDEAIAEGAMALFGEKYGDLVRVVSMGDWSKELCGGTHVRSTGDIGLLVITSEGGIGSGVRRIEALAGAAAYTYVNDLRLELTETASALEAKPGGALSEVPARARQVMAEVRDLQKRVSTLTHRLAAREAEALVRQGMSIDGLTVVADRISADSMEYLEAATDAVKARLGQGIVILASVVDGKPSFRMAVTRNLRDRGFHAGTILREAARQAQGGAGGDAEFAQGGVKDASKVDQVLHAAVDLIRRKAEG
jgi:alanyl-tRNA synthetase